MKRSTTIQPLSNIFKVNKKKDHIVAFNKEQSFTWEDFKQDIYVCSENIDSYRQVKWGLYSEDSYLFAVGLFALLLRNKDICLLNNIKDNMGEFSEEAAILTEKKNTRTSPILAHYSDCSHKEYDSTIFENEIDLMKYITVYTSGSSGKPKKIEKYLYQLDSEILEWFAWHGEIFKNSKIVSTVRHNHQYGLIARLLLPLMMAVPYSCYKIDYITLLLNLQDRDAILISSPAHLSRIKNLSVSKYDVDNIKAIFSAGSPLELEDAKILSELYDTKVIEIYGNTESGAIAKRDFNQSLDWQPSPNTRIKVSKAGILQVLSPYSKEKKWENTGDFAQITKEGRFQLLGRADNLIKIGEMSILTDDVASALKSIDFIKNAVVHSIKVRNRTILATAIILQTNAVFMALSNRYELIKKIRKELLKEVEGIAVPKRWCFLGDFPLNTEGKISKDRINRLFECEKVKHPVILKDKELENKIVIFATLPDTLFYFQGHFDKLPILAGVVQINWAVEYAEKYFNISIGNIRLRNIKFFKPIPPIKNIVIKLEKNNKDMIHFSYSILDEEKNEEVFCSKGSLER